MAALFKVLQFKKNEYITKKDDVIDYFGIILHGTGFVSFDNKNYKMLGIGDMVG